MNEAELTNSFTQMCQLGYSAGQWWVTSSTALIIASYLAAKYIPTWLLVLIFVVYGFSAASAVLEFAYYSEMAGYFVARLQDFRASSNIAQPTLNTEIWMGLIDMPVLFLTFFLGSVGTIVFSLTHWRRVRRTLST